jgi:hypothetical protein
MGISGFVLFVQRFIASGGEPGAVLIRIANDIGRLSWRPLSFVPGFSGNYGLKHILYKIAFGSPLKVHKVDPGADTIFAALYGKQNSLCPPLRWRHALDVFGLPMVQKLNSAVNRTQPKRPFSFGGG